MTHENRTRGDDGADHELEEVVRWVGWVLVILVVGGLGTTFGLSFVASLAMSAAGALLISLTVYLPGAGARGRRPILDTGLALRGPVPRPPEGSRSSGCGARRLLSLHAIHEARSCSQERRAHH